MRGIFKLAVIVGLGLGLQSCGKDDGEELARFTGTWSTVSGTATRSCPGSATETFPGTGNIVWSRGVSSDLVQSNAGSACVINADVAGTTASGSGPPCVLPWDGGSSTLTVASYTFVISSDGRTAQENASGTVVFNGGGASLTCTITATASYQKIGQ